MNFHQQFARLGQQCRAHWLIIDESARGAFRPHQPFQRQRLAIACGHALRGQQRPDRMPGRRRKLRRNACLRRAVPDDRPVRLPAKRQRQRIQNDRFARPGFPGKRRKALTRRKIEPGNEHEITNGQ